MIDAISQKVYTTLTQDSVLQSLLPNVKDNSNIWELRMPDPAKENKFPIIVFRVVSGSPLLEEQALDAFNWFIELDIVGNQPTTTTLWTIYKRIYALLENSNMSNGSSIAYKCKLDFFNTDYDKQTLTTFITTRWQFFSIEFPSTAISDLG